MEQQTLAQVMSVATARGKADQIEGKTNPILGPNAPKPDPILKVKSFHEQEMDRDEDSAIHDFYNAQALGRGAAISFMNSVTNINAKTHEADFATFKNKFHSNPEEAEEYFVNQKIAAKNVRLVEKADPTYEATLLRKYKPTGEAATEMSMKFFSALEDSLRQKWFRTGYAGDRAYLAAFCFKYGLKPNDQISALKEFEAKK
jgi:hypothetical protein